MLFKILNLLLKIIQLYISSNTYLQISSNAQKQLLKNGDIQFISHQILINSHLLMILTNLILKVFLIGMGAYLGIIIKHEHDFIKYKDLKTIIII